MSPKSLTNVLRDIKLCFWHLFTEVFPKEFSSLFCMAVINSEDSSLRLTIHLYPVLHSLTCTSLSFTFHLPTTYSFRYMTH